MNFFFFLIEQLSVGSLFPKKASLLESCERCVNSHPFTGLALNFYVLDSFFSFCNSSVTFTHREKLVPQNNDFKEVCNHSIHSTQSTGMVRLSFFHSSGSDQKTHSLKSLKVSSESKHNCNSHQIFKDI